MFCRSIRVTARTTAEFSREVEGEVQHVDGHFLGHPQLVAGGHDYDIEELLNQLNSSVETYNSRGSGFTLDAVTDFTLIVTQYRPLAGLTYIPTPPSIASKKAVINVQNRDNRCFMWSVLSCLYPLKDNPCKVHNYRKYQNTLNFDDISFPVHVKDIPKFEKNNPEISVNVISQDTDHKGYCVEYLSPERHRRHHVNLLLLSDSHTTHYVWIKNFSRLLGDRTKSKKPSFVCCSCLNVFSSQRVLDDHIPNCMTHAPQMTVYPDPDDCTLSFGDHDKQHPLKFYLVCDFESFLVPIGNDDDSAPIDPDDDDVDSNSNSKSKSRVIDEHRVSGYCCYRVTDIPQYQTPPMVYSGLDVMAHFYEHVMSESETISEILSQQVPLSPMSDDDKRRHRSAVVCENCHEPFTHTNYKTKHHCHVTGDYLFSACNNCNLQLKHKKLKVGGKVTNEYFLPIVFHNLKNYDSHFILKHFEKRFIQRSNENGKISLDNIKIIPLNGERFLQFQLGNLKFLDSFQFLSASLEDLVELLLKSGKENFPHTTRHLGDNEFAFAKGVYPYSYMTDSSKFDETVLPSIENFYNTLHDEPLSAKDYERAHQIWDFYGIQNLRQYHDHYLKSDVLLLADVFEHFRHDVRQKHALDCLYFPTLPSLSWSMALKHTKVELELITDPEMYLMVENSIRGGISTISNRYAKANNPLLEGYDPDKPTTFITYLDMNNLYGGAQSEPLPVGDFRFLTQDEIEQIQLDLESIPEDSPTGYIIDCDLSYPAHLHDKHSDYPLAPEHLTVTEEMLSPFARGLTFKGWRPMKKLVPNLYDKSHYVTHYRNLQFYIKQGLVLTKIHRVISFTQRSWLKPWIDFCTTQRQNARSEFESDLAKLQANSTYGKTMEQVRNRQNIRLIADPKKLLKAVSKPSYREAKIINPDLVMVRAARQKVHLDKPIAVGFCILELSKLTMYKFFYEYLKPTYGDRCKLLFTDTDSLCCEIETTDLYHDMGKNLDLFDTSNFEPDHPLYSMQNHRVLGKMKSETGSLPPSEFVGLRAKMYSLSCGSKSQKKAKGIKKRYVKNRVQHESFAKVLKNTKKVTKAKFRQFKSTNHVVNTVQMNKLCLSALDDKRYILDDGMSTIAYGHIDLRN